MNVIVKFSGTAIVLLIILVILTPNTSNFRSPEEKYAKACTANQMVIEGAIEDYNQKNPGNHIKVYEGDKTLAELKSAGVLKSTDFKCFKLRRKKLSSDFLEYWFSLISPLAETISNQYRHDIYYETTGKLDVICIEHENGLQDEAER
ncbi:MAG: hypothetical protein ACOYXC_04885 [Candidatus Rifleibacteriota bacterium]